MYIIENTIKHCFNFGDLDYSCEESDLDRTVKFFDLFEPSFNKFIL